MSICKQLQLFQKIYQIYQIYQVIHVLFFKEKNEPFKNMNSKIVNSDDNEVLLYYD